MLRAAAFLSLLLIAQVPSAAPQHPYVYRGTVQAVQPRGNSLDVVTGVGYALRLVHMRALPATLIRKSGAHAELRQLVTLDLTSDDPIETLFHALGGDKALDERVVALVVGNNGNVRTVALVARAGMGDLT